MERYHDTSDTKAAQDANLKAALALAKAGKAVFPARADTKRPHVKDWQNIATTDPAKLRRWWRKWPDAMPALPTGERNGIAVLDLDQKNDKDGAAALLELGHDPAAMIGPSIATPSGGRHIYFRHQPGLRTSADKIGPGVDVRAEGGFVIAPGAVNGKGVYGKLSGPLKRLFADLPEWPAGLKPPPREPGNKSTGEKTGLPFAELADAFMAIPNDKSNADAESRDWWLKMLAALHHETDGSEEGLELAHEWSDQHDSYDPENTDATWRSFRRDEGATGASILREAYHHGWINRAETDRLIDECWTPEELARIAEEALDPETLAGIEELLGPRRSEDRPKTRLTFLSPSDCEDMPTRRYVIKGLLAEGDVGTIVGAPGAGKSLLAPYLGYMVARGEPAFERRTRQGGVFYVAAEDGLGMRARTRALRDEHGEADGFKLVTGVSDLLAKNSPDLKELLKAVKRDRPSLIIVDTIAVAFPGLEENDAKSMGQVVHVARRLAQWGAAVLLIHHDTKEGSNGLPRGHSILNGALDVNLYLKREDGAVTGKLTKNRNGSTDEKLAFTVATIPLGEDEDGDTITTAICREADASTIIREKPLTPKQTAALGVLVDLIGDGESVSVSDWRKACIECPAVSAADMVNDRRKAFRRIYEELSQRGAVFTHSGFVSTGIPAESLLTDDDVEDGT